jgi:F-type H+-transporting ATPase subunit g
LADIKEPVSKAASSAKQSATDSAGKAAANAQEYANKALEQSQKFAKAIGDTSGRLLQNAGPRVNGIVDRVIALQKPIVYWARVSGEVAKQGTVAFSFWECWRLVYLKEKMSPPSGAQFQETFQAVRQRVSHPNRLFNQATEYANLGKLQELGWQPIARAGLKGIELFGFFCVGEMIGRRSIKGYKV